MGSNDLFQQRVSAQAKENQKNPEKADTKAGDRNPSLLKRVGKSLLRIAEAPLHVVGGALEATGHALTGRLDKSLKSLAGGVKAGFGSLHEGIREIPLVGDVIQKVEKVAFGIHENMRFTGEDENDIKNAEDTLRKTMIDLLGNTYANMTDKDLKQEADELRKSIQGADTTPVFNNNMEKQDYRNLQNKVSGLPDFDDLNDRQKSLIADFDRRQPDLNDPIVKEFLKKVMTASAHEGKKQDMLTLSTYTLKNLNSLGDKLHLTSTEKEGIRYMLNLSEKTRRMTEKRAYGPVQEDLLTEDDKDFIQKMDTFFMGQMFGEYFQKEGGH